jgi:hypothetical protein
MKFTNKCKILGVLMLVALLSVLACNAQNYANGVKFKADNFLSDEIYSLVVSNTLNVTNLAHPSSTGINYTGVIYTNAVKSGGKIVPGARRTVTASAYTNVNLLDTVDMIMPANGTAWTTVTNPGIAGVTWQSPASVSVTFKGDSAANSAVQFTVGPVWDGEKPDTSTANDWTFAFTASSSEQTLSTNAPIWLWQGAGKLMLKRIVNTDVDASSAVEVKRVSFNRHGGT